MMKLVKYYLLKDMLATCILICWYSYLLIYLVYTERPTDFALPTRVSANKRGLFLEAADWERRNKREPRLSPPLML